MLNASLLAIIEEAGVAVLTLTEGLEKDEFLASPSPARKRCATCAS